MSGLVVAYAGADRKVLERMFEKISHRGAYISGISENIRAMIAQNYLRADTTRATGKDEVPVTGPRDENGKICYDVSNR